ncbi:MAG: tyrosine-type recombinase/integrase [Bacteroidetes bacterium]|nr:tyrosine-type recombinase/integrase [Bacteroidota bacterium]
MAVLLNRKYSNKTIEAYSNALVRFGHYLHSIGVGRVQDVVCHHLDGYRLRMVEEGLSNATIYLYLRSVRYLFKYLEENQHVFINPAGNLALPTCKRKLGRVPTEEEVKKVLAQPNPITLVGIRDRAMLEVFYTCGLRLKEMVGLTIFSPDTGQSTLRLLGKGNKERIVPLGKEAVFWLKKYMESVRPKLCKDLDEKGLWISKTGTRLSRGSIANMVRLYGKSAGLSHRLSCHCLRRACATHMLRGGAHPVQIQMLLGHAGLSCLSQYLQVTITDMKKMHQNSKPGK